MNAQEGNNICEKEASLFDEPRFIPIDLGNIEISEDGMYACIQKNWVEIISLVRENNGQYYGQIKTQDD